MSTPTKNVYALGASRNIGYFASLRLLAKGVHITFLLRSPAAFESDPAVQPYIQKGQVRVVKGDATNAEDVKKGWETAIQGGDVDLVLFTVGGLPHMTLTQGFVLDPPDLCTHSFINVLTTMPASFPAPPRIIGITSIGTTHDSHESLPMLYKPLYSVMLASPHRDKNGLEMILGHISGKTQSWGWAPDSPDGDDLPGGILSKGWKNLPGLPKSGSLPRVVVVRPAFLTDGECRADEKGSSSKNKGKEPYRASEGELKKPYTVSRKDVAHFIVEGILADWEKWEGKCVSVAY